MGIFGAGGAFSLGTGGGATFGTGGILGTGGSPAAGILGTEGAACPPPPVVDDPDDASWDSILCREMICVYGLGPLGVSAGACVGSAAGRIKEPVASLPGTDPVRGLDGISTGEFGGLGIEGAGGVEVTMGVGATKTGSGREGAFAGDALGNG